MSIRALRHRLTPEWFDTVARRRWRDRLFRRLGIQRCYTPPLVTRRPELAVRSCLPYVVAQELLTNPDFTFLQIGAFDGVGDDDLRQLVTAHRLKGLLIEPQPIAFARLQHTYRDQPQVVLMQAAIAEQEGTREFYCRRGAATMAASFDRGHLLRHSIPSAEIVVHAVKCHTVVSALRAARFDRVDLLQIDAEGFDWPILRSIDFAQLRPAIVRFEYRNLPPRDADACLEYLARHGYRFLIEPRDIIAHRIDDRDAAPTAVLAQRRIA